MRIRIRERIFYEIGRCSSLIRGVALWVMLAIIHQFVTNDLQLVNVMWVGTLERECLYIHWLYCTLFNFSSATNFGLFSSLWRFWLDNALAIRSFTLEQNFQLSMLHCRNAKEVLKLGAMYPFQTVRQTPTPYILFIPSWMDHQFTLLQKRK